MTMTEQQNPEYNSRTGTKPYPGVPLRYEWTMTFLFAGQINALILQTVACIYINRRDDA
jgi:hypothetical protein